MAAKAKETIPNVYFGPGGVSRLLQTISDLRYNEKDYFSTKSKLINELGYINDSASISKVVGGLKQIYEKAADTSTFQNAVYKALAKHKTRAAYDLLKTLLIQDPPVFDNASDYSYLFQDIQDSLPLARSLFPELLQLAAVDDYKDNVNGLLTTLVDSGYLHAQDYQTYFSKLLFEAKIQWKKQQGRDEQQLQKKNDDNDNDRYDAASKEEEENLNALQNYAILLMPFYDGYASVPHFFDKLLQSRDAMLRLSTAVLLLRKEKKGTDSIIAKLAADDKYRSLLFNRLQDVHKEKSFPAAWTKQVDIARSQLASSQPGKEWFAIEYAGRKLVQVKQRKGWVYFFKYKTEKDDAWQMGISGLQPADGKAVSVDNTLVKATGKKVKSGEPVLDQFDIQLKKMIFSLHKSAASFYLDNDYYAGRNEE